MYSDVVFINIINSKKSSVGYVFQLYRGLIIWKASKQLIITILNIKAELLALIDIRKKIII